MREESPTIPTVWLDERQHNYLGELNETLQQQEELTAAMKQVIEANEPIRLSDQLTWKLDSLGLVRKHGDLVEPRCQLYRLYFQNRCPPSPQFWGEPKFASV